MIVTFLGNIVWVRLYEPGQKDKKSNEGSKKNPQEIAAHIQRW